LLNQEEEIQTLRVLGLTLLQAKVYLALLKTGRSTIKKISERNQMARQEVQRVITELANAGFVEKALGNPPIYRPVPIKDAVDYLLECRKKESIDIAQKANRLLEDLAQSNTENISDDKNAQFIIINGKDNILRHHKKILMESTESGNIIHGSGATAGYSFYVFEEEANKALKRNVRFRIISGGLPSYQSPDTIRKYLDRGSNFEVRFLPCSLPLTMSVFDNKGLIVYMSPEKNVGDAPILWTDSPGLILLAQNYFEQLWEKCEKQPTKHIKTGQESNQSFL
jgi:sugar-specific transcriptional regulator TrmB